MAVADAVAVDEEAVLLGAGLLLVGRRGRDRLRPEAGHRGHDLEHRARHVASERGARQEWLGRVGLEPLEGGLGRRRVRDGRRVVGRRRGEREHLAIPRIEHHDRAAPLAERGDGGPLEVVRERQGQVLRVVAVGPELGEGVGQRIDRQPGQLGVERSLEPGASVDGRCVAHDLADGAPDVDPVGLAVGVLLVAGQDLAGPVLDRARASRSGRPR